MNTLPLLDIGGIWHIAIFAGIFITLIKLIWLWCDGKPKIPLPAKLLWIYVLTEALFILEFPAIHFGEVTHAYQASAGQTFVEALFIPACAVLFYYGIKKLLPYFVGYALICVWMNWPGLLHAPSFHLAFAALAIPFIPELLVIPVYITILSHHGTTAAGIAIAQLLVYFLKEKKLSAIYLLLIPAIAGMAYIHSGPKFDGTERLEKYFEYMRFWAKEWRWILIGVGPGSFTWTAALLDKFKAPLFLQMHSDWLQIVFELGLAGFALAVSTLIIAIKTAWDNVFHLSALAGCAVFALSYHPLRFFTPAVLIAFIFVSAFTNCRTSSRQAHPSNSSDQAR